MNKIDILTPDDDVITKDHGRYITVNYKQKQGKAKKLSFIPDYHRAYDPL